MRAATLLLVVLACVPAYREEATLPPPDPYGGADRGPTVVGHVRSDGTLVADTVAGSAPDTARVERETVLTGTVKPRAGGEALATGWRVQVLATPDRAIAERYAGGLAPLLGGEPIYVEWVQPWWKVRVGDFGSREPAERLRERLVARGIPEAWTVRTTIRTAP